MESGFYFVAKVAFLIDGFNLFHALDYFAGGPDRDRYHKYKWISLRKLCSLFLTHNDRLEDVLYFTTLATWDAQKALRHKLFIKAQEAEGTEVIYGEFKRKQKRCSQCGKYFWTFEEKQTDVNIALRLFQMAVRDKFDKAIILSGDTDLIPAIKAVRQTFPGKQIGVIIPIGRASEDLKKHADFYHKMKERQLASSRYPDTLTLPDGSALSCPGNWK